MAGRKHHYIPQFLQKGFAVELPSGRHAQVWVFRKNAAPRITSTAGTFAARDFYGDPGQADVDDILTKFEQDLSTFVDEARKATERRPLGHSLLAARLAHQLSIRSRWLRDTAARVGSLAINMYKSATATPETEATFTINQLRKKPAILIGALIKEAQKRFGRQPAPEEKRRIKAFAKKTLGNRNALEKLLKADSIQLPFDELAANLPGVVAAGHLKALGGALGDNATEFRDYMESLTWEVAPFNDPLILGDCGPVYFDQDRHVRGPMGAGQRVDFAGLILPIATFTGLVGSVHPCPAFPRAAAVNKVIAEWSDEAFIASENSDANRTLHSALGSGLSRRIETETKSAFQDR